MLKKLRDKLPVSNKALIQIGFVLIAFLYGCMQLYQNKLMPGDSWFNMLRFKEASAELVHGQWPQFSWYTTTIVGGATPTFYPWLLFLPLLLLMNFMNVMTWQALAISIGLLVGLEATYFSMQTLGKPRRYAVSIALLFCLSTVPFGDAFSDGDLGAFYVAMLAPMILTGWLHWIKQGKWKMMAVGLSLCIYIHLAATVVVGVSLVALTLFAHRKWTLHKIINGCKALGTFVLTSSVIWIPIMVLEHTNKIALPTDTISMTKTQTPLLSVAPLVVPMDYHVYTVCTILALILAIRFWKKLGYFTRIFTLWYVTIVVINTHPVCIWLLQHTPVKYIQFTRRFDSFGALMGVLVLMSIVQNVLVKRWKAKSIKRMFITIGSLMALALAVTIPELSMHNDQGHQLSYYGRRTIECRTPKKATITLNVANSKQYEHYLDSFYPDYYPKSVENNNHRLKERFYKQNYINGDELRIHAKYAHYASIPAVIYNAQKYNVAVNYHKVATRSNNHRLIVPLKHGNNIIKVSTPVMNYRYGAMVISIIGWIIIACTFDIRKHQSLLHKFG